MDLAGKRFDKGLMLLDYEATDHFSDHSLNHLDDLRLRTAPGILTQDTSKYFIPVQIALHLSGAEIDILIQGLDHQKAKSFWMRRNDPRQKVPGCGQAIAPACIHHQLTASQHRGQPRLQSPLINRIRQLQSSCDLSRGDWAGGRSDQGQNICPACNRPVVSPCFITKIWVFWGQLLLLGWAGCLGVDRLRTGE